jgi:hypothetical protein
MLNRSKPLKRKTPLRSKPFNRGARKPGKPRKGLKPQSKERRAERMLYGRELKFWIALPENEVCACCIANRSGERWEDLKPRIIAGTFHPSGNRSSECHHSRGRIGRLLNDKRFWAGVCSPCHKWLHEYPREARQMGLLSSASEWNVFPAPGVLGFPCSTHIEDSAK